MRDYELVVIVSPEVSDEALAGTVEKVSRWISEKGGNVTQVEPWGRRKLAYPIKRFLEGSYILTRFQGEAKTAADLEASLRISEEVLRHLLVKVEA